MKFEELYKDLLEAETDLLELNIGEKLSNNLKGQLETIRKFIFNQSLEVFLASKTENVYWSHCSTATYNWTYKIRLMEALNNDNNSIHNEVEFIESEIQNLIWLRNNFSNSNYNPDLFNPLTKKIKLLEYKRQELLPEKKEESLDFSDSSAIEKVVFLYKTGILDFLRQKSPFIHSTNKLAEFLSAITGEKTETLQPNINPIYSPQADQKRNPLNKQELIKRVEKHLNIIGFSQS
ncbi:MAG TPA: hypothetical protein PKN96_02560 [Flavobacterium sp.]|uniref:hypothetical protein n=1 Tax=Flavobacterium sp. TaxID=239 RepID=UPI002C24E21F|nr:hypothetical protein [Flavobacterium sp.]HNP32157.1 hypothetical protein [Flavobacterium sp.]